MRASFRFFDLFIKIVYHVRIIPQASFYGRLARVADQSMNLKTNLHFHSAEDKHDNLNYSAFDGIDKAVELGFDVLALTCHEEIAVTSEIKKYAEKKGVLLISGAELNLDGADVLVLGTEDKKISKLKTLQDLRKYKRKNPGILVIAPHPYYFFHSLGGKLKKNIDIFDAIEHSWFFFFKGLLSPNFFAGRMARKTGTSFIATSDTHNLDLLDLGYAVVNAEEKTQKSLLKAVKEGDFYNVVKSPKLKDVLFPIKLIFKKKLPKSNFWRYPASFLKKKNYPQA